MKTAFNIVEEAVIGMGGGGLVLMTEAGDIGCACPSGQVGVCGSIERECQVALRLPGDLPDEIVLVPMAQWPVGQVEGGQS